MPEYSIRVGESGPVFLETDDPLEKVVDKVLRELYGEEMSHEGS